MTADEIRLSGLLELYVLGQLSAREHQVVWQHIAQFPDLRKDLASIERAVVRFAQAAAVQAPAGVRQRILDEINKPGTTTGAAKSGSVGGWRVAAAIAALVALGLMYLYMQRGNELRDAEGRLVTVLDSCNQASQTYVAQINTLQQLTSSDNQILHMVGTPGFPQTDLYFYHNPVARRNFIVTRNMPTLAANQSFQLWSLKPGVNPIPLDVFQQPTGTPIEVRFEDATATYAITIEPLGGQQSPTLANLIGAVNIGG